MIKTLAQFFPKPIVNYIRTQVGAHKLRSVPESSCDTQALIELEDEEIRSVFLSKDIDNAWRSNTDNNQDFQIADGSGGVNPGDRRALFYIASWFKPQKILEIGTHIGASTRMLAAAMSTTYSELGQSIDTLDIRDVNCPQTKPWLDYNSNSSPKEVMQRLGLTEQVRFLQGDSIDYMSNTDTRYDLIFLDGDHSAETVYRELPLALKILNQGGLIILHDYFPDLKPLWNDGRVIPGPYLGTKRLQKNSELKIVPLGKLPWETKLGSKTTSLALVTKQALQPN